MRLTFLDPPAPEARVWEALEHEQRAVVIDVLARLLVKTIADPARSRNRDDE